MPFNQKLAQSNVDFESLGFIHDHEEEDPRGHSWNMSNDKFKISIDAWYEVFLTRKNPDSDQIRIDISDKFDLNMLIAFIED